MYFLRKNFINLNCSCSSSAKSNVLLIQRYLTAFVDVLKRTEE